MGWKDSPTWLKGGIIGALIGLTGLLGLILARTVWTYFGVLWSVNFPIVFIISLIQHGWLISIRIMLQGGLNIQKIIFYSNLSAPIIYFIIGSLIGLIVEKIKSKKKE